MFSLTKLLNFLFHFLRLKSDFSDAELAASFKLLASSRLHDQKSSSLKQANALVLHREHFPLLRPTFVQAAEGNFDAALFSVDFAQKPKEAVAKINKWARVRTGGGVKKLITNVAADHQKDAKKKLLLFNALHFKGRWPGGGGGGGVNSVHFDLYLTIEKRFSWGPLEEQEALVPMMQTFGALLKYVILEQGQLVELPYGGGGGGERQMLVLFLPNQAYLSEHGLTISAAYAEVVAHQRVYAPFGTEWAGDSGFPREVNLALPRFKLETTYNLVQELQEMGIRGAFSEVESNFSRMAKEEGKVKGGGLRISDVLHKAVIQVDEEGEEYVVGGKGGGGGRGKEGPEVCGDCGGVLDDGESGGAPYASRHIFEPLMLTFNRPFLFAVCDRRRRLHTATLAVGILNKPEGGTEGAFKRPKESKLWDPDCDAFELLMVQEKD